MSDVISSGDSAGVVDSAGAEGAVEAAESDLAENYEAQEDGSAEGERGELLPDAAAEVQAEQRKALGKKKVSLKVNGRDTDYEVDLDNDEELAKHIQKAMAADEKFQEAASIRKQMQQFVQALKADPLAILAHPELGINVRELAERVINQELDDLKKTPEQKRMEELERQLKSRDEELNAEKEAKRNAEMSRLEEQAFQELDRDIDAALSNTSLPKSPFVMKRIADALITANDLGYTDVKVKDIMPFIESSVEQELQEMFGRMPEEVIERLMGTNLDRVRKAKIAKAKKVAPAVKESAQSAKPADKQATKEAVPTKKFKNYFSQW